MLLFPKHLLRSNITPVGEICRASHFVVDGTSRCLSLFFQKEFFFMLCNCSTVLFLLRIPKVCDVAVFISLNMVRKD